ncbi:uncharacterized protein LOC108676117 [Hyalella azteca]|uniref:Uncharacterized protein LOC108676117 n=1 Tax=Hyalella azteca TaxID=294128 RepID=A0A8B7P0V4_HYAAZ|nr:uncharacterized protein LOC108676117 [Hyalella azteca]
MATSTIRAHALFLAMAYVAVMLVPPAASATDLPNNGDQIPVVAVVNRGPGVEVRPADPFVQIERSAQTIGHAIENFFNSLFNRGNSRSGNTRSGIVPLVAIDNNHGPVIDIPGILGLNTGATNSGPSLVSVATNRGGFGRPSTQVNIPGILDLDVGGNSPRPGAKDGSLVSVLAGGGETRVRAPLVQVAHSNNAVADSRTTDSVVIKSLSSSRRKTQVTPNRTSISRAPLKAVFRQSSASNHLPSSVSNRPKPSPPITESPKSSSLSISKMKLLASSRSDPAPQFLSPIGFPKSSVPPKNAKLCSRERGIENKFPRGFHDYERTRIDRKFLPNYFVRMNPSPYDIPEPLLKHGYDSPHKVRIFIINRALKELSEAKSMTSQDDCL